MRLTAAEFWELTPYQFTTLLQRWDEDQAQEDRRFGILISLVHNMFAKRSQQRGADHFFPRLKRLKQRAKKKPVKGEAELRQRLFMANMRRLGKNG